MKNYKIKHGNPMLAKETVDFEGGETNHFLFDELAHAPMTQVLKMWQNRNNEIKKKMANDYKK